MKKLILLLVFLFLSLQIVSAVGFEMKEEFSQGETLLAKISGNFLQPVLKENVNFYRGHVKIPIIYDIAKINNEYFLYAQLLGKGTGNYSVIIENARYMKGAETSQEDIVKNFTITNETADFTVNPGFIIATESFFIEVQNLQDNEITVEAKTKSEEGSNLFDILFGDEKTTGQSVNLISGQTQKIYFDLNDLNSSVVEFVEVKTENTLYEVPVYIIVNETQKNETSYFKFRESSLDVPLSTEFTAARTIKLENRGEKTIENITISLSNQLKPYVNLSKKTISRLEKNESVEIDLTFSADEEEKTIDGRLTAKSGEIYAYLPISLTFVKNFIPKENAIDNETNYATSKTCAQLNGTICKSNEECEGQSDYARDANCCRTTCVEVKKSSSGKLIGWLIVVVIIIFVVWFFKSKYKGASRKVPF